MPTNASPGPTVADLFAKGRRPHGTRERILFAALDHFSAFGFHAVGLDRILDAVGVTKTTFYKHFDSRDDLILEALALRTQWETETIEARVRAKAGYDPRAMLLALFDVLDEWFNDPAYRDCIFMSACAEYPSRKHPVHRAATATMAAEEAELRELARAAGVPDPDAFAKEWKLLLAGAVARRLTSGDDSAAKRAKRIAERLLEESLRPS